MSRRPTTRSRSASGSECAASAQSADAQSAAQRARCAEPQRLVQVAADTAAAAAAAQLSPAQRCAGDALALAFEFLELKELAGVTQTCKTWLTAAAKEKPRELTLNFEHGDRLGDLCASRSALRRHIGGISLPGGPTSLQQLGCLQSLPSLSSLRVQLCAAELAALVQQQPAAGRDPPLAQLRAAFPPRLRDLTLLITDAHSAEARQLLLDALPAMAGLERLSLIPAADKVSVRPALLSLDPLLQLPHLAYLTLFTGGLTVPQLRTVNQIASLRSFDHHRGSWNEDQLAAFCRPPHRLQQLEELNLRKTFVYEEAMAELLCLPALTALEPGFIAPEACAFLPRFPRLQRLRVRGRFSVMNVLISAVIACPTLTDLTLSDGKCPESFGDQLMKAVPRLRSLTFKFCSLPSLRFLRHAPHLKELSLICCRRVRPGHAVGLGSFAPQLERVGLERCDCPLDEAEVRMLTPPGALGLPQLREFTFVGGPPRQPWD